MRAKNKYKKVNGILSAILVICVIFIAIIIYFLSPVSSKSKDIEFIVTSGESLQTIGKNLKKEGLIKSDKVFLAYVVLKNSKDIYAAKYKLNTNMSLSQIVSSLKKGGTNKDEITLTFKEGINMREIAKIISKQTNNSYDDVLKLSNDEKYIDELIKKYWFITKDIKNKNIYYKLEGYLFPDSYNFSSKNVTTKEIFDEMIAHMDKNITKYKKDIQKSGYSVHQILTVASMIELEVKQDSRKDIAGLFYNRLKAKMSLGSDPTSYYGAKKEMTEELYQSEYDAVNPYNTRSSSMAGKLPVGPISSPSLNSIIAAVYPTKHDYYYFVTDKNGKVYLTKDYDTHNKVILDLKNKGLWFEW